jgi:hypothetical protein
MGIEKEKCKQREKGICTTFNKIITENFPNPEKIYSHTEGRGLQNTKRTGSK